MTNIKTNIVMGVHETEFCAGQFRIVVTPGDNHLSSVLHHDKIIVTGADADTRLQYIKHSLQEVDWWTAEYVTAACRAVYSITEDVHCAVVLKNQETLLQCFIQPGTRLRCRDGLVKYSSLSRLYEHLNSPDDEDDDDLKQARDDLTMINVAADDVLRIVIAAEHIEQHDHITEELMQMLGLHPDSCVHLSNTKDLSTFLKLRTVQSIVKKVNRTVARHLAFKALCSDGATVHDEDEKRKIMMDAGDAGVATDDLADIMMINVQVPDGSHQLQQHCNFGFLTHLFSMEPEPLYFNQSESSSTVFLIDSSKSIVDQVRRLNILEKLISEENQDWRCLSFQQFYQSYKSLLTTASISDDDLMSEVMKMIDDDQDIEINDDTGQVIMGSHSQRRLEMKLLKKQERSAVIIQRWWRRRSETCSVMMMMKEADLIETVLRKYETLQRQSKDLVFSFTDKNNDTTDDTIDEVLALPAHITQHDDHDDVDNEDIVLKTSQFYGLDLVKIIFTNIFPQPSIDEFLFQSRPPPLPTRRDYKVNGEIKIYLKSVMIP